MAFKRGEGSPISNIDVVIGKDSHVKEGFVKINKDLNGGEKEPFFSVITKTYQSGILWFVILGLKAILL